MFVSLLQMMGFLPVEPVHSRASEKSLPELVRKTNQTPTVQDNPVRRSPVKAQTAKPKATAQKAAALVQPAKVAKSDQAGKSVKAAAPVEVTAPGKTPSVKPAAVPPSAAKQAPVKVAKASAKPVAKPVKSVPKKKPQEVTTQTPVSPKATAPAAAKPVAKAAAPTTQMTPSGVPVRTGRPSSRLAQLTVPSMAQTVASTAAKSSFSQMTSVMPIVSPLASSVKKDKKLANNWKTKPVNELTDAEILAMSDDDYMNDTQLAYFRLKLVQLKNDMLANAGETTEHLREDTVVVPDPADRATIEEEHALELRTRDRERKLLKKIEQSITRIDAGDYGYCDETGEAIGVGRLLARPTATLSLEAQQRRELKQKMFGD
ncbi:MAG: RNA polymerase-binding protein DksA [Hydrogenophaga sp.]